MVLDRHKAVFIHIPRTGGLSLEQAFSTLGYDSNLRIRDLDKYLFNLQHAFLFELEAADMVKDDYWSFCFTRNPFDRVVSIYEMLQLHNCLDSDIDFEQYCLGFETGFKDFIWNNHYSNDVFNYASYEWAKDCDFVFRFEDIEDGFKQICNRLDVSLELPHINQSYKRPYKDYYTKSSRAIVESFFYKDIEIYDYRFGD